MGWILIIILSGPSNSGFATSSAMFATQQACINAGLEVNKAAKKAGAYENRSTVMCMPMGKK